MTRSLKMFLVVLIACWLMIIFDLLIRQYSGFQHTGVNADSRSDILQALFYSIPFVLIVFGLLHVFNLIVKFKFKELDRKRWSKKYYFFGLLFVLVIPLSH
jgi:hypothetical protein